MERLQRLSLALMVTTMLVSPDADIETEAADAGKLLAPDNMGT